MVDGRGFDTQSLTGFFSLSSFLPIVKRNITADDDEGLKMKEQAILNLSILLSKTNKAEGTTYYCNKLDKFYKNSIPQCLVGGGKTFPRVFM